MDLALAVGRGPRLLAALGDGPLVREEDVVVLGTRPSIAPDDEIARTRMALWPLERIRREGGARAAQTERSRLRASGVRGFWIHLDADVLDDEVMPAVDARQPGGLSFRELGEILRALLTSDLCAGLQVTIYDPERDPDGTIGRRFADAIVASFPAPAGGR
jgi:arginase